MMIELENAIAQAQVEIQQLRRRNEVLEAQVHMVETCAMLVRSQMPHGPGVSAGEDIAWKLGRALERHKELMAGLTGKP